MKDLFRPMSMRRVEWSPVSGEAHVSPLFVRQGEARFVLFITEKMKEKLCSCTQECTVERRLSACFLVLVLLDV